MKILCFRSANQLLSQYVIPQIGGNKWSDGNTQEKLLPDSKINAQLEDWGQFKFFSRR